MAKIIGRTGAIGIAVETTKGTGEAPAFGFQLKVTLSTIK
jgi:hypothetical protein